MKNEENRHKSHVARLDLSFILHTQNINTRNEKNDTNLSLSRQRIYHRCVVGHQWGLEQVRQQRQNAVETLKGVVRGTHLADFDALADLAEDGQVDDQRHGQQRVLAGVVHHDRVLFQKFTRDREKKEEE